MAAAILYFPEINELNEFMAFERFKVRTARLPEISEYT